MFPLDPSDVALIFDLVLAAFFAVYFAAGKPRVWYRDRLGWVIFGYALSVVALLGLIVYGIGFGQKVAEPIRFIVATALAAALIAKTWSVHRERRAGRLAGERPATSRKATLMSDKLIPADASLAAKRGFIRTTAQAYGTALAGGVTAVALTDAIGQVTSGNPLPLIVTTVVTVVSPLIAGAASYFSILSKGIPADYETAGAAR